MILSSQISIDNACSKNSFACWITVSGWIFMSSLALGGDIWRDDANVSQEDVSSGTSGS